MVGLEMIEQTTLDKFDIDKFWNACKHFDHTICIIRTDKSRIVGCYSPQRWMNSGSSLSSTEVVSGNTFALYFDDLKLRICKTKKGLKSWI